MNALDLTPLFRSTVGFDALSGMLDAALEQAESGFPWYNIEKTGQDTYRIDLAIAGFNADDVEMVSHEGVLVIRGKVNIEDEQSIYLYHGIPEQAFERRFQLADYVEVDGARLENGILRIGLVRRVPEALKARQIKIVAGTVGSQPLSETQQASKAA